MQSISPSSPDSQIELQVRQQNAELIRANAELQAEVLRLRHIEQEFRLVSDALENALECISRLDHQGHYVRVNQAYARAVGYQPEEMLGLPWQVTIHADELQKMMTAYQHMLQVGRAEAETIGIRKDGSEFHKQIVMVAIYNDARQLLGHYCFMKDITERKEREAALEQSEARFRHMCDNSPIMMHSIDKNGILLNVNRKWLEETGYSREEVIGRRVDFILTPESANHAFTNVIPKFWHTGSARNTAYQYVRKDGTLIDVLTDCDAVIDPSGKQIALSVVRNVTQQKQIERALSYTEARYRAIVEDQTELICRFLADGTLTFVNEAYCRYFGKHRDELLGHSFVPMIPVEDQEIVFQQFASLSIDKPTVTYEHRVQLPNGEIRWQEWTDRAIFDQQSHFVEFQAVGRDITEQKQAEQALKQAKEELERALSFEAMLKRITEKVRDSLNENQILQTAVQELALGLEVDYCDTGLYDLKQGISVIRCQSSPSVSQLRGATINMADHPDIYPQLLQGQVLHLCKQHPDLGWVVAFVCPIVNDCEVLGDLWLFKPKTEQFNSAEIRLVQQVTNQCAISIRQARLYQAAQAQVEELEKLNRLKDDFLSTVSHELRSPVSNMKMAIQMLELKLKADQSSGDTVSTPQTSNQQAVQRYLQILQAECKREIDLINDLLDLQRLEREEEPLACEKLALETWLLQISKPLEARAHNRQQTLQVQLAADLPTLITEVASLERILAELLTNACKYTPPGGEIVLNVRRESDVVWFDVSNTGISIPENEIPHIFNKFYRIPNADPWKQGGTGLGLALVKQLTERLGGVITAESWVDGTRFSLILPIDSSVSSSTLKKSA